MECKQQIDLSILFSNFRKYIEYDHNIDHIDTMLYLFPQGINQIKNRNDFPTQIQSLYNGSWGILLAYARLSKQKQDLNAEAPSDSLEVLINRNWKFAICCALKQKNKHTLIYLDEKMTNYRKRYIFREHLRNNFLDVIDSGDIGIIDWVINLVNIDIDGIWESIHESATFDILQHFWLNYSMKTTSREMFHLLLENDIQVISDYFENFKGKAHYLLLLSLYRTEMDSAMIDKLSRDINYKKWIPLEKSIVKYWITDPFIANCLAQRLQICDNYQTRTINMISQWKVAEYIYNAFSKFPPNIQDILGDCVESNDINGTCFIMKNLSEEHIPTWLYQRASSHEMKSLLITLVEDYEILYQWREQDEDSEDSFEDN